MYTLMIALPSGSVYSVVKPIEKATGLTLNDLNTGTGVMFLAYGWACVVWQPLALQYGKRPAYLFSMLASIAIMTSAPWCTTRNTYLANKVLQGFFGAPVEALCEISITDVWFAHERPKYLAWYGFGLSVTGKLAPMLAGFINDGQDWRWVLWWTAIWIAIAFVYCFFLMEGTHTLSLPSLLIAQCGGGSIFFSSFADWYQKQTMIAHTLPQVKWWNRRRPPPPPNEPLSSSTRPPTTKKTTNPSMPPSSLLPRRRTAKRAKLPSTLANPTGKSSA